MNISMQREKKYTMGLIVSPSEVQHNLAMAALKAPPISITIPEKVDWRNIPGKGNFTTPVKNQAGCGACVAFATCGLIESMWETWKQDPNINLDLSEAYLFPRGGGNCATGATFERMLLAAESGVCDEKCCPYSGDWKPCPDYKNRLTKISGFGVTHYTDTAKAYLATTGPVMTGMEVYEDFFYYSSGIYEPEWGAFMGNHAVLIIGYDNANGCWICKNSWGTDWGDNGYFRIKFGQCGMGSLFPYYTVSFGDTPPGPGPDPTPTPISPDLVSPTGGTLCITPTITPIGAKPILSFNGKEFPMTLNDMLIVGTVKKGDKLAFDIKGVPHKNACFPVGWRIWELRMGNGAYRCKVQIK